MQPPYSLTSSTNKTIYINPNFKRQLATTQEAAAALQAAPGLPRNTHINPLFLEGNKQIHMNPNFLIKLQKQQQQKEAIVATKFEEIKATILQNSRDHKTAPSVPSKNAEPRKIISKSKNRLIREPLVNDDKKPPTTQPPLLPTKFQEIKACDLQNSRDHSIAPAYALYNSRDHKTAPSTNTELRKIICKSKNRLIREPLVNDDKKPPVLLKSPTTQPPLLVLNKRKLIRKSSSAPLIVNTKPLNTSIKRLETVVDSKANTTKYKLDNRAIKKKSILPPTPIIKRTSFVGQYALRRTSLSHAHSLENKKSLLNSATNKSLHKKLQLLNINGLLYKSTRNSLKLREPESNTSSPNLKITKPTNTSSLPSQKSTVNVSTKSNQGLTIFVRGTKYIMDSNKFKLTRANAEQTSSIAPTKTMTNNKPITATFRQRIDIGGYTYISANSAKNVFIRSTNHLARAYVHNAKQKSLQMLTKRLVKSNIPCPIYQRIGKCAAFNRGKCFKVHNKLQVAVCSKFLRGECLNSKCLLSHNVSLSKMPVCKFFLQGVCVRNDCPYLHKKLSNNAEICIDFLRGFCQLADKCNKRHEFVCPKIERNDPCTTKNFLYCKSKLKKEKQLEKSSEKSEKTITIHGAADASTINSPDTKETPSLRYFKGPSDLVENSDNDVVQVMEEDEDTNKVDKVEDYVRKSRPKLGALPAFIPL